MAATSADRVDTMTPRPFWRTVETGPVTAHDLKEALKKGSKVVVDARPTLVHANTIEGLLSSSLASEELLRGRVYVFNKTGAPVMVYMDEYNMHDVPDEDEDSKYVAGLIPHSSQTVRLDPDTLQAVVRIYSPIFLSVQQLDQDGNQLDQWHCLNVMMDPPGHGNGKKLVVTGTTTTTAKQAVAIAEQGGIARPPWAAYGLNAGVRVEPATEEEFEVLLTKKGALKLQEGANPELKNGVQVANHTETHVIVYVAPGHGMFGEQKDLLNPGERAVVKVLDYSSLRGGLYEGEHESLFVSIQRMDKECTVLNEWHCIDKLVKPGTLLEILGDTPPKQPAKLVPKLPDGFVEDRPSSGLFSVEVDKVAFLKRLKQGRINYAFVVNSTGSTSTSPACDILVYVNKGPKPFTQLLNLGLGGAVGATGEGSGNINVGFRPSLLQHPVGCTQLGPGKTLPVPVGTSAYITVQRLGSNGNKLDKWDCCNHPVKAGDNLKIYGDAVTSIMEEIKRIERPVPLDPAPAIAPAAASAPAPATSLGTAATAAEPAGPAPAADLPAQLAAMQAALNEAQAQSSRMLLGMMGVLGSLLVVLMAWFFQGSRQ